jgi:site-specific DNA-cytosine methylase
MWYTKRRRAQTNEDFETWIEGGVVPTLNAFDNTGDSRATVLILDGTRVNDVRVYDDEITPCLKNRMGTGGNNVPFVAEGEQQMQVRRLTPTECERLMGWPDNHTLHRADGKTNSDTTRYKMCGNGVASPVAQWIAEQINRIENDAKPL